MLGNGKNNCWHQNRCMAILSKTKTRCHHHISSKTSDFCRYHKHRQQYSKELLQRRRRLDRRNFQLKAKEIDQLINNFNQNNSLVILLPQLITRRNHFQIEFLDRTHPEQLYFITPSWKSIPSVFRCHINGEWWELKSLVAHLTSCLNNSDMNNPQPVLPLNPFTRIPFTLDFLKELGHYLQIINLPIPISLFIFLMVHCYEKEGRTILDTFNRWMRFRIINRNDSQDCYQGFWVYKFNELTPFEQFYHEWYQMPLQQLIINAVGMYEAVENQYRINMKQILDNSPAENLDPLTDSDVMTINSFFRFYDFTDPETNKSDDIV